MDNANTSSRIKIQVSMAIGDVSAIVTVPVIMQSILVLAHGAGAGMEHNFMEALSTELAKVGIGSVRYNFPYMENGKKRPDFPAVAEKTVEAVIEKTHALFPSVPLLAGGKSFGGRMTSQYLSKNARSFVRGIVFYGFPLHPAGQPSKERASHLSNIEIPMLFLQGTKDTLAEQQLIQEVCIGLKHSTLHFFERADHSFKVPKQNLLPDLAGYTKQWIEAITNSGGGGRSSGS